jgi:hypothetical protein
MRSNLPEWMTSAFSSGNRALIPSPGFVGLGVNRLQLDGFRSVLQDGERAYLDQLGFGEPQLLQDYFLISDSPTSNRVCRAVCVLYRDVFLLCRYVPASSLRLWDRTTTGTGPLNAIEDTEKLFIYGYLYPRHIDKVTATRVGIFAITLRYSLQDFNSIVEGRGWVKIMQSNGSPWFFKQIIRFQVMD